MKKILSIMLSIIMLLSISAGIDFSVYALNDSIPNAMEIEFNTVYSDISAYDQFYKLHVPVKGYVTFYCESDRQHNG